MKIIEKIKRNIKFKFINKEVKKASPEVIEMRKKEFEELVRMSEEQDREVQRLLKGYQVFNERK